MENRCPRYLGLAIFVLILSVGVPAAAQQSAAPSKPAAAAETEPKTIEPAPDKVVIKVGETQVTQREIDFLISNLNPRDQQSIAAEGKRPLADQYVKLLLLSRQAESEHLEATPAVRDRIELQRAQTLAQAEYEKMSSDVKVSPDEIGQYFTAHQPEYARAQVRKFVVIKKAEGAKEGATGLAPDEAKAKVEALRKALTAGTDVAKIAQDFAKPNEVLVDKDPESIKPGQLLPALDKAAFDAKDGDLTEPLDTPRAIVFLQVVGHHPAEQKDVSTDIENTLREQKLDAAMADLRKKTDVWLDEDYFKSPAAATPTAPAPPPAPPKP